MRAFALAVFLASPALAEAPMPTPHWAQGQERVRDELFPKLLTAAKQDDSWYSGLFSEDPAVELSSERLPEDSPLVHVVKLDKSVILVGKAAFEFTHSDSEMAFLLAHELRHTRVRAGKKECVAQGFALLRQTRPSATQKEFYGSPAFTAYTRDLERDADAWGQAYADRAGYNALDGASALEHTKDWAAKLGARVPEGDHDSLDSRVAVLRRYSKGAAPYTAPCPWPKAP